MEQVCKVRQCISLPLAQGNESCFAFAKLSQPVPLKETEAPPPSSIPVPQMSAHLGTLRKSERQLQTLIAYAKKRQTVDVLLRPPGELVWFPGLKQTPQRKLGMRATEAPPWRDGRWSWQDPQ